MLNDIYLAKVLYEEKIEKSKHYKSYRYESYRFSYRMKPKRQFATFLKTLAEKLEPSLKLERKLN